MIKFNSCPILFFNIVPYVIIKQCTIIRLNAVMTPMVLRQAALAIKNVIHSNFMFKYNKYNEKCKFIFAALID